MKFYYILAQILLEDPGNPGSGNGGIGLPKVTTKDDFFKETVLPAATILATFSLIIWIIIGGLRYVTAAGNPEQIAQAKNTILYGVIGLFIVFFAVTIVNFVVSSL